jgi:CRISPR-associated endonuclease/helicase Cas3
MTIIVDSHTPKLDVFMEFSQWFEKVTHKVGETGKKPFPYQIRLALSPELPPLLNVPTGVGKTAAVVLSWLWRRRYADPTIRLKTPRRLVYCLPMRTLVEQIYFEVKQWLDNDGLAQEVELHILMGGAVSVDWDAYPEKDCILIGTQDQLLSRALNRGYGISRYRWQIHFALLNNDCLWAIDEVQLMGVGLTTTAQLQWFRQIFHTYGPTQSLWMSATLDKTLLETVNYQPQLADLNHSECLNDDDWNHSYLKQRLHSQKQLQKANTVYSGKEKDELVYIGQLAQEVVNAHQIGSLTLVICNRVRRSQQLFKELKKILSKKGLIEQDLPLLLIHSRFRGCERDKLNEKLRDRDNLSGIVIATQAIEAGVDISAHCLFTELAPWSSLIQRVGRCNRYGVDNDAIVYWIDIDSIAMENTNPYTIEELRESQTLLNQLTDEMGDIGLNSLNTFCPKIKQLPHPEGLIPRKQDLFQLFDTSTDLAGHDIDISPFIRDIDNSDVSLAWRDWEQDKELKFSTPPQEQYGLQKQELCRVSINQARGFLKKHQAWIFDRVEGVWTKVESQGIYPGISLLLHTSEGGYSQELGFTGDSEKTTAVSPAQMNNPIILAQDNSDFLSEGFQDFVSLKEHSQDTFAEAEKLSQVFSHFNLPTDTLTRAARWHDAGKVHPLFQEMLTFNSPEQKDHNIWAKSNYNYHNQNSQARYQWPRDRKGFRHELVSAILALQEGEEFLLAYLTACHHGKVRMTIQSKPNEKAPQGIELYALGVHHGDNIPAVDLGDNIQIPSQTLSLKYMELGDNIETGESWVARSTALLEEYGPFQLAFLESLIRIADWRASQKVAPDITALFEL